MPKCKIKNCENLTRYKNTIETYCSMHRARIKRNGNPKLKEGSHGLEKLPHLIVDDFIRKNCKEMIDREITKKLIKMGIKKATWSAVRYRRRKLGIKKYLYGEVKKHKAWVKDQAVKKYGNACELCDYKLSIDVHHIIPRKEGGKHEVDNLMIVCPNCHALITRKKFAIKNRKNILSTKENLKSLLESFHPNLG